jgi:rhodanese-related sulfurtransferase
MAEFLFFLSNHPILTGLWVLFFCGILLYHRRTSAASVSVQQAILLVNRSEGVILDIRDKKEFDAGHIVDAINIPVSKFDQRVVELSKYKKTPVVVVCKLGQQSGDVAKKLTSAGHEEVVRLGGGISEWQAQSLPLIS